jgi:hypothetical protein
MIFTDPPFGANINYSEMNLLWESWLGEFTNPTNEAIVNRTQSKALTDYEELMTSALKESFRVLRSGHWMLLVFMNSSGQVWEALKSSVLRAGFVTEQIDIFDKQHGTFKQFVSENTAGCDLVLHCRKPFPNEGCPRPVQSIGPAESIRAFLEKRHGSVPTTVYLHVSREAEIDFRMLYSEWIAYGLLNGQQLTDLATFREIVGKLLSTEDPDQP